MGPHNNSNLHNLSQALQPARDGLNGALLSGLDEINNRLNPGTSLRSPR